MPAPFYDLMVRTELGAGEQRVGGHRPPLRTRIDSVVLAVAFVDCCGYSAYTLTHGDRAGVDAHLIMRDNIDRSARRAGATVVKWMGDGVMLVGDTTRVLLLCIYEAMCAMRQTGPLAMRAGVTIGPVTRVSNEDTDYFGNSVNRAAQLCAGANAWQVCMRGEAALDFTLRAA